MSDAQDRIVAIKLVTDMVQPDVEPRLTTGQIELAVDRSQLASTWIANTAYNVGDVVVPVVRINMAFECIQAGTSQANAHGKTDWPTTRGDRYAEGTSSPVLIWEAAGTDLFNPMYFANERNVYDINRAAKECWAIKLAQASQFLQDGDVSFQTIFEHCKVMVEGFRPFARQIQLVRC